jgi:peptidoglycan pentaglycine glycine transferase (the first glycine)
MIVNMEANNWNRIIATFQQNHLLQSWQWGDVKSNYGWKQFYKIWGEESKPDAAALILQRELFTQRFGRRFKIFYVPKGPLIRDWRDTQLVENVLDDLQLLSKQGGGIFIKIDPDIILKNGDQSDENEPDDDLGKTIEKTLKEKGWDYSADQIQFKNTVILDLTSTEEEILSRMKQKTRYNIRLAGRKGVKVRVGTSKDFDVLYQMYAETSLRDGFAIRHSDYYHNLWGTFIHNSSDVNKCEDKAICEPLIAEIDGEPVAAVVIFRFSGIAYYLHGMSRPIYRKLMPNYLLQWEAIRRGKIAGCTAYDLWGAPENFDGSDPMWGVYRFKQGFGGNVQHTIGAYDFPTQPVLYSLYIKVLPKILNLMRKWGNSRTKQTTRFGK